ncbi:MAG: NlpC/P60 family protein [Bacteroidota bacterium]
MQYGICHLSVVPVMETAGTTSPMISQLLYGEHFKVLEKRKQWSKIRNAFDQSEGWTANNQFLIISETEYKKIDSSKTPKYSLDLISFVSQDSVTLIPIVLGSSLPDTSKLPHDFDGVRTTHNNPKDLLVHTALMYLNAPYQLGGRTPFGLDGSGFTQMVYKLCGHTLSRQPQEQSLQGDALSFIEESDPGDLAFFDNAEGEIFHVGIILKNNFIIHVNGKVRVDRLDHTGIFNTDLGRYTHNLRVIKKVIASSNG